MYKILLLGILYACMEFLSEQVMYTMCVDYFSGRSGNVIIYERYRTIIEKLRGCEKYWGIKIKSTGVKGIKLKDKICSSLHES